MRKPLPSARSALSTAILFALAGPAWAVCSNNAPASGETVTCTTAAPNPQTTRINGAAGVDAVTVLVQQGAGVTPPAGPAIWARGNGWLVDNAGQLVGVGNSNENPFAIRFDAAGGGVINRVINRATGTISGGFVGVQALDGVDVNNAGFISGGFAAGILVDGRAGTIVNSGTIEGRVNAASGVLLNAGGSVTNQAGGVITTSGTVSGQAITIDGGGSVDNAGVIVGANGVFISGGAATVINRAGGSISAIGTAVSTGDGNDSVDNAGLIRDATPGSGAALQMGGGNDTLTLRATGVMQGTVDGGAGDDALVLDGVRQSASSGTFGGFEIYRALAGSVWSLPGTVIGGTGLRVETLGDAHLTLINISGSGGLFKTGGGTLVVSNNNTYTGTTTVDAGTLNIAGDSGLGAAANVLDLSGGTLQARASFTAARNILLGSNDANSIDTNVFDVTLSGVIGDGANNSAGNFVNKLGAGTLTLSGVNTYSNRTVLVAGTLALAGNGTLGAGNLVIGSGTVFDISQTNVGARVVQLNGPADGTIRLGAKTLTLGFGNSSTDWAGTIADGGIGGGTGGRVEIAAPNGAVRFFAGHSYTGGTTVASGTFELVGDGALFADGAVTVNAGALFQISGLTGTGTDIGDLAGGGAINLGAKSLTFGTSNSTLFSGVINGAGGALVKQGSGMLTLSGSNTYSGGTRIEGGALSVSSDANLGDAAGALQLDGGTLRNTAAFESARAVVLGNGGGSFLTDADLALTTGIAGSGGLAKQGAGTLRLAGASTYTGGTRVETGTLLVEGSLGETATTVFDGATLGGSGTIAGDVNVLDGATLSPGSSAGTLTVGSLTLSDGSILDYELGQAGVIGSGVNDLIEINGDLTLDGTLDITDIGGFGAGVYRLMNYGGTLTDNGLELGALPTGSDAQDLFLQTAIDGQVNLVNSAGLTLSFWDGSIASEHNNGAIDDGDGVWDASNDNWTAADGAVNGRWDAGTFAVFGGAGGTVSLVGEQAVAGMQFMAGYTLEAGTDGALRIDGAESVIRVDPTVTATIAAPITGAGGLVKTDTGTLVLSGVNTYSGGTAIDMGTLQVSADNNLGDAAGALSFDGGTLRNTAAFATARAVTIEDGGSTFETAADLTVAGTIDGDGALAKTGDGVLTLTGTNTYSGGTTVAAGTLSVSADANLGDAAGALTLAGGTLQTTSAFDSTRDVVLAGGTLQTDADLGLDGTVSGGAGLIKDGAGTLTLTGDNTYTGGTRVLEGTLVGDAASIRGDLDNAGTVVFDQGSDASFDGAIVGSGDMVKRGAGALTLGAASALDWSIDTGALIARAAQFGGDVAIADGATLRFTEAGGSYGGTLSGAGDFEIAGGSTVFALTGNSSGFGGTTSLESGTLRIDGSLGGLTLIAAGATLTGTGRLSNVDNAGTVAAGNSIGTLTLTGDYIHRDDATLLAEIEPGGSSDLLDIAGTATIEGGTVDIIKLPGQYEGGTRYTLIDAAGGVTGTFDTLEQDLPFLDLLLVYDPGHVYLDVVRNEVDFDIVCGDGTFNQCQVAGALDRVGEGETITPDLEAVLTEVTTLTLDQARAGFDRLSGEAHASLAGAMLEGHALYGQTVTRRIADRREALGADRLHGGAWVRGYGSVSDLDGDGNAHGADVDVHGVAFGADAWGGESWLVGASVNALKVDADFREGDGGEADAKNVALYTSVQGERAYLDAVASYAWWDNEVRRRIEVGTIARDTDSEYGAHRFALALEAGLTYAFGNSTLQPLLSVEHSLLSTQRFREDGADDIDLIGSAQNLERTVAGLGVRWSGGFGSGAWTFAPTAQLRWLHTFGDLDAEFDVAFAGAPDISYRVRGVTVPEDRGLLGVGLLARRENLDLFVDLDYQAGDGYEAGSLGAGVRWRW